MINWSSAKQGCIDDCSDNKSVVNFQNVKKTNPNESLTHTKHSNNKLYDCHKNFNITESTDHSYQPIDWRRSHRLRPFLNVTHVRETDASVCCRTRRTSTWHRTVGVVHFSARLRRPPRHFRGRRDVLWEGLIDGGRAQPGSPATVADAGF